jgi:hypothetical protein
MSQVITFEGYRPSPRYDSIPWTEARIEESTTEDGPWTEIETIALSPVDSDPSEPALRNLTTELASDDDGLWYRIVFLDATGDSLSPTDPVQNLSSTEGATSYATVSELARILKIRTPSDDQTRALERVLRVAAGEIDTEIDLPSTADPLSGWQLALANEVNLERAVEHWRQQESPFGLIGLGGEIGGGMFASTDSWERHAKKLAPLKQQWGIA